VSIDLSILSATERGVFNLYGHGMNREEIAARLFRDTKTIDCHTSSIRKKLGARHLPQLIFIATLEVQRETAASVFPESAPRRAS